MNLMPQEVEYTLARHPVHSKTPYLPYNGGQGGIKMASASTLSANEPAKDLIYTVQLKQMKKSTYLRKNGL